MSLAKNFFSEDISSKAENNDKNEKKNFSFIKKKNISNTNQPNESENQININNDEKSSCINDIYSKNSQSLKITSALKNDNIIYSDMHNEEVFNKNLENKNNFNFIKNKSSINNNSPNKNSSFDNISQELNIIKQITYENLNVKLFNLKISL